MARPIRLHLSWRRSGDSLDLALAVNRCLARGHPVWWCRAPSGPAEPGDYLVEGPPRLARALAALGLQPAHWPGPLPRGARLLTPPRIALLAGEASAYPYFAYYALCLVRLGLTYCPVDGAAIAGGALAAANLLVLPGGFAIWGLDVAERAPGADAAVRAFLGRGGACLGSCGGAFYLSAGRPGWTGTAWLRPRYTHEYLQSGTGVVSVALAQQHALAVGCPPTMEVPYYHGPIYDGPIDRRAAPGLAVAAVFDRLVLPGRLAIDNPLDARRFELEMAGRPAVLEADGPRGRAVLFSPHPEMGDLVRKYTALDGYVRRYLGVRGHRTMVETLFAYRPLDAPAFRLVLNAVHHLAAAPASRATGTGSRSPGGGVHPPAPGGPGGRLDASPPVRLLRQGGREVIRAGRTWAGREAASRLVTGREAMGRDAPGREAAGADARQAVVALARFRRAAEVALAAVRLPASGPGAVARAVADDLRRRLAPAAEGLRAALGGLAGMRDPEHQQMLAAWIHVAETGAAALAAGQAGRRPTAERLLQVELAVSLCEAWQRFVEANRRLGLPEGTRREP